MDVVTFLDAVNSKQFLNDKDLQDRMTLFAVKSMNPDLILILLYLAQIHTNTNFPINVISRSFKRHASVEQVLDALAALPNVPVVNYFEEIFARGSNEQIQRLGKIRESWALEEVANEQ